MHPINDLNVPQGSVAIYWFGQSSYALKDPAGTIVLVDPYFPRERPAERYIHSEAPVDEASINTDGVLLTHDHRDHTWPESLERIHTARPQANYVGPAESMKKVRDIGVPEQQTLTVTAGDQATLGSMQVHAVFAKPPEGDPNAGIEPPDVTHLGYVVDAGGVRVYISGDPINTFADNDELVEVVRSLSPDIGLLTTHPTEGEFPFFDGSVKMAQRIGLKAAVPAHYDCFVKRTYDPKEWDAAFPGDTPERIIIPYNEGILYSPK